MQDRLIDVFGAPCGGVAQPWFRPEQRNDLGEIATDRCIGEATWKIPVMLGASAA